MINRHISRVINSLITNWAFHLACTTQSICHFCAVQHLRRSNKQHTWSIETPSAPMQQRILNSRRVGRRMQRSLVRSLQPCAWHPCLELVINVHYLSQPAEQCGNLEVTPRRRCRVPTRCCANIINLTLECEVIGMSDWKTSKSLIALTFKLLLDRRRRRPRLSFRS